MEVKELSYNTKYFDEAKIKYEFDRLRNQFELDRDIILETLKKVNFTEQSKILDVGCGYGFIYELINEEFSNNNYVGIDNSEEYIKYCKKEYKSASFICKDCRKVNELTEKFDYIYIGYLVQHIHGDFEKLLNDLMMKLNKGGKIIILDINKKKNYFEPKIDLSNKIYSAEKIIGKVLKNDIMVTEFLSVVFGKKFKRYDIWDASLSKNKNNFNKLINMVNLWKIEVDNTNKLVKSKLITVNELNNFYDEIINRCQNENAKVKIYREIYIGEVDEYAYI